MSISFPEYEQHDALSLAALVRDGQVSPAELIDAAAERISAWNPAINAVVSTRLEQARAEVARGTPQGVFGGVPFLLKDLNIQFKGERTTNGGKLWADHVATFDSTVLERYRAAGLVVLGFANTAELGLSCDTAPAAHGATRNPWNLGRSAGGSSGGSAAAVAAGIVPASHATDGGGSIRIPSSNTGVFGLKPTRGRVPYGPVAGEGWNGLSVHHAITRSVRDSAALLDATHGPAPGDPYAAPTFVGSFLEATQQAPRRLRIAFQTVDHEGRPSDPACVRAVEKTAALLARLGHHVEEARPDLDGGALKQATRTIVASNVFHALAQRGQVLGRAVTAEDVEPTTWAWAREAERATGADLLRALGVLHGLGRQLGSFFERYDVLLTPTFAAPPLPLRTVDAASHDFDAYYDTLRRYSAFTSIYNSTGVPAASVPLWWDDEGLPVGVQIAAPLGEDALVLALSAELERAQPWFDRLPAPPQAVAVAVEPTLA